CSQRCKKIRRQGLCRERRSRTWFHLYPAVSPRRMTRVLIVEDEEHLALGLKFNLEAEGIQAEAVGDGERALKELLAANNGFDAVILDVRLPGRSGFEVVSPL